MSEWIGGKMKKAYGDFRYSGNTEELKRRIICDKGQYEELQNDIQRTLLSEGAPLEELPFWMMEELFIRGWEYNAKTGVCDHYFFTGENFSDWLSNTSCPIVGDQVEIMKDFFSSTMGKMNSLSDLSAFRPIMFHFKPGNHPAILLGMRPDSPDRHHISAIDGHNQVYFYIPDDERLFGVAQNGNVLRFRNLVSSAVAYISCFPETVIEGIPEDLKHPNHFRNTKCFSVGVADKISSGGTHDSPCPHYRVGHWRYLSSEKFTKKRGQTIFVCGTFVKGRAITVLSPEEVAS